MQREIDIKTIHFPRTFIRPQLQKMAGSAPNKKSTPVDTYDNMTGSLAHR